MTETSDPIRSYLLRCWLEDTPSDQKPIWRFTITRADTRERVGCADLEQVVNWLTEQTKTDQTEG